MKKILPYILIFVVVVQLFAPFTFDVGTDKKVKVVENKAEAVYDITQSGITIKAKSEATKNSIKLDVDVNWGATPLILLTEESILITLRHNNEEIRVQEMKNLGPRGSNDQSGSVFFHKLEPNTNYEVIIKATQRSQTPLEAINNWRIKLLKLDKIGEWTKLSEVTLIGDFLFKPDESSGTITNFDNPYQITTLKADDNSSQQQIHDVLKNEAAFLPQCSVSKWSVGGCVGIFIYRAIFQPSAYLFAITGKLLDYTFFYTIQDTSYRSTFVVEGWGIVRDFCNMFFIFILLYIAFGTILNLNGVKTKEMIINVVIIGLLINFSLFATHVIIDASNILARVFYNQILIGNKDKSTNQVNEELGFGGSKQLTVALINKINPQKIIISADKASKINGKGIITSQEDTNVDSGTFIMVSLLASIMNIVGLYVFFMVSLVFIARVIGLWLAMIVVPIAFFSYAIPQIQDTEMIGWKKWWPDTLKMAFLAPIFIAFLYLIIMFLSSGMGILNANDQDGTSFFISIIVPFAFLMILLLKAKDITTKMSGKIGETLTGIAKTVGGTVVGAGLAVATGGAAMAMRGTLGAFGNKIGNSDKLAKMEAAGGAKGWAASKLRNIGTSTGKSSFDIRSTKLGAMAGEKMGVNMGKAKEGGYDKYKEDKHKKRLERADKIKEITTKDKQKDVTAAQIDLKETMLAQKPALDLVDKDLAKARQDLTDAKNANDTLGIAAAKGELDAAKLRREAIRKATTDSSGNTIVSIEAAEKAERDALHDVSVAENTVLKEFANSLTSDDSIFINLLTSLGQDRRSAIEKTATEIRKGTKAEKDTGDVGH